MVAQGCPPRAWVCLNIAQCVAMHVYTQDRLHALPTIARLTKISSAKATPSPFVATAGAGFSAGSRKGFLDMAGNGYCWTVGSGLRGEGEAVLMRLRKGLLEAMLRLRLAGALLLAGCAASVRGLRVSGRVLFGRAGQGMDCDKARSAGRLKQEGG
jgi:hypothetical protein